MNSVNGLDLLGLRAVAQNISNHLLNGITTIAPTVRYISLRAWIAKKYADAHMPDSWKEFRQFAGVIEAAVAMGNLLVDKSQKGLVGSEKSLELIESNSDKLALGPLVSQLAVSAYTGPSNELGITYNLPSGVPALIKERGIPLSLAVDKILKNTKFSHKLSGNPEENTFSRDELIELGKAFPISQPVEEERKLLIDIILPASPSISDDIKRIGTYGLLLELCQDSNSIIESDDLFKKATAVNRIYDKEYNHWWDGWELYLVRDMLGVVHEMAFQRIISELEQAENKTALGMELLKTILQRETELEDVLKSLQLFPKHVSSMDQPLSCLYDGIKKVIGIKASSEVPRWDGLNELDLINLAGSCGVGDLVLLPVAWLLVKERCGGLNNECDHYKLLSYHGSTRIGVFEEIMPYLNRMLVQNISIRDAVYSLALLSVQQHLRIAWSRLGIDPKRNVAVIYEERDMWILRKTFKGGRTNSRLDFAIGWLEQLKLIDSSGCTSEGRNRLEILRTTISKVDHNI